MLHRRHNGSTSLIIKGYKSIAELSIAESPPFITFCRGERRWQSNITCFWLFGAVVKTERLRLFAISVVFSRFIVAYKLRKEKRTTASIHLAITLNKKQFVYDLAIKNMDAKPAISERLEIDGELFIERKQADKLRSLGDNENHQPLLFPATLRT